MPFHLGGFRSGLSTLFFLGDFSPVKIPKGFALKQAKKVREPSSCKDGNILEVLVAWARV